MEWDFLEKQKIKDLRPLANNFISVYERLYQERTVKDNLKERGDKKKSKDKIDKKNVTL